MMDFSPDKIYERLVTLGEEWANANYAAELLEETRKTLISQLGAASGESSASGREAFALRHADYAEHIQKMVKSRHLANLARVRFDTAKTWVELKRTEAANERATNRSTT